MKLKLSILAFLLVGIVGLVCFEEPIVQILSPLDGSIFTEDDLITFSGTANDPEDGDLSNSITWQSDLDGPLGTGSSITTTLSDGQHTVIATAVDSDGISGTDQVGLTVDPSLAVLRAPVVGAIQWFDSANSLVDVCPCANFQGTNQCVRRWEDLSGRTSSVAKFDNPTGCGERDGASWAQNGIEEKGIDFGQDDIEKPEYIANCVNGHYCISGGRYDNLQCGGQPCQNLSFEVESHDRISIDSGPFTMAFLLRNADHGNPPVNWSSVGALCCGNRRPHIRDNGEIIFRALNDKNKVVELRVCPAGTAPIGEWAQVIITRDAQHMVRCYTEAGEVGLEGPGFGQFAATDVFSAFKGRNPFLGQMAAMGVWHRELSASERQDVFDRMGSVVGP